MNEPTPADEFMLPLRKKRPPTPAERAALREILEEKGRWGVLRDTGLRRGSEIVWAPVQPDDYRCPTCGANFAALKHTDCSTCAEAAAWYARLAEVK